MANPVGITVLTKQGILALTDASQGLITPAPKYFKASSKDYGDIYNGIDIQELEQVWYEGQIANAVPIDDNTVEFILDIPPDRATNYARTFGLYLDNGVLFALSKTFSPYPPLMHLRHRAQLKWSAINKILDFKYIPFYETEQYLSILDLSATLGELIIKHRKEIERLKEAREALFANSREFKERIEELEKDVQTLWNNQLAIFASLALHARLLVKHRQEIERLKGGV